MSSRSWSQDADKFNRISRSYQGHLSFALDLPLAGREPFCSQGQ